MASVVDICKLALGTIGNSAEIESIDPPDGSPEADHCASFYPMARDEFLETYAWSFATARKYLAELSVNEQANTWGFAYQLPSQMIRPLALLEPGGASDVGSRSFLLEAMPDGQLVLYSNVEAAVLKYIYRQEDPSKFTPLFTVALATNLASYLAGPIRHDEKLKAQLKQQARQELQTAASFNRAQKVDLYKNFVPEHLVARG